MFRGVINYIVCNEKKLVPRRFAAPCAPPKWIFAAARRGNILIKKPGEKMVQPEQNAEIEIGLR